MIKTNIEKYAQANGISIDIKVRGEISSVSVDVPGELYQKVFSDKSLQKAIEMAIENHRGNNE